MSSYNAGNYISCIIEIGNYVACASGSHEGVGDVELLHCEEANMNAAPNVSSRWVKQAMLGDKRRSSCVWPWWGWAGVWCNNKKVN